MHPPPASTAGSCSFTTRPGRTDQRGVVFSARIGTKLYGMVGDDRKVAGEIAAMSASADGSSEHYAILFKNTGNVHVYVNGRIEVRHDGASSQTYRSRLNLGRPRQRPSHRGGWDGPAER